MPQRFLRPGITTSERWNSVSFEAQSLFIRILTLVDDFGRYDARIPILHGQCFAMRSDVKAQRTAALRQELKDAGLISVYSVGGREYLQVSQWQERARSTTSRFPDPQDSAADCEQVVVIPQDSAASLAIDHRSSIIVPRPSDIAISSETMIGTFEEFWQSYPKKVGKADAERAWAKHRCANILPQILTAIRKCKISADWTKDAGQFIPHPATWLNRRGWEDELAPARNGSSLNETSKLFAQTPVE